MALFCLRGWCGFSPVFTAAGVQRLGTTGLGSRAVEFRGPRRCPDSVDPILRLVDVALGLGFEKAPRPCLARNCACPGHGNFRSRCGGDGCPLGTAPHAEFPPIPVPLTDSVSVSGPGSPLSGPALRTPRDSSETPNGERHQEDPWLSPTGCVPIPGVPAGSRRFGAAL